jgi:hypothetical protein
VEAVGSGWVVAVLVGLVVRAVRVEEVVGVKVEAGEVVVAEGREMEAVVGQGVMGVGGVGC